MDRKDTLVSTEDDKDREELHIRNALKSCGYPKWIFDKVKHDRCQKRKKTIDTNKRNKSAQESKGLAVIPYVEGLSETAERILHKYGIQQQQQNLFQQYKYGYETLQDNETTASPPKRPTHSRANWRMSVQDSMP